MLLPLRITLGTLFRVLAVTHRQILLSHLTLIAIGILEFRLVGAHVHVFLPPTLTARHTLIGHLYSTARGAARWQHIEV